MMIESKYLKIKTDYTSAPGPRFVSEGPFSGEDFRDKVLYNKVKDAIQNNYILTIDLDGVSGYASSFLEEAFGGLIREKKLDYNDILSHINIVSNHIPELKKDVMEYLKDEYEKN